MLAGTGMVRDSALQAYVQAIGGRMAAAAERPHLPWTFRVVDDLDKLALINGLAPGARLRAGDRVKLATGERTR